MMFAVNTLAPGDLDKGAETQAWLAVSNEDKAKVSGRYFYHKTEQRYNPVADLLWRESLAQRDSCRLFL